MRILLTALLFAALSAAASAQTFRSADGYSISFTVEGSGRPMIVIPGGPGLDSAYLRRAVRGLNARAFLIDPRGTGNSHVPETPAVVSVDKILNDIDRLRQSQHIDRWIVMGHSFGGWLAQAYAARYPAHVSGVLLVSSSAPDLALEGQVASQLMRVLTPGDRDKLNRARGLYRIDPDGAMRLQMDTLLPYYMADRSKWAQVQPYMDPPHNSYAEARALEADLAVDHFAGSLRPLHVPMLVVYGENDGGVDEFSRAIRDNSNNPRIAIIPRAGHFVWVEQPGAFRSAVNRFLANVKS